VNEQSKVELNERKTVDARSIGNELRYETGFCIFKHSRDGGWIAQVYPVLLRALRQLLSLDSYRVIDTNYETYVKYNFQSALHKDMKKNSDIKLPNKTKIRFKYNEKIVILWIKSINPCNNQ